MPFERPEFVHETAVEFDGLQQLVIRLLVLKYNMVTPFTTIGTLPFSFEQAPAPVAVLTLHVVAFTLHVTTPLEIVALSVRLVDNDESQQVIASL